MNRIVIQADVLAAEESGNRVSDLNNSTVSFASPASVFFEAHRSGSAAGRTGGRFSYLLYPSLQQSVSAGPVCVFMPEMLK